jgi:hypothetical protein
MARYAVVENEAGGAITLAKNFDGIVLNVIEADENFPAPEGTTLVASDEASKGDTYEVRKKTLLFKAHKGFIKPEAVTVVSPQDEYAAADTNTKKIAVIAKYAGLVAEEEA